MPPQQKKVLFFLFFISGFCGLLYQVVWLRLAFASFGIVTPVLSLVISVFMLGLAVGSWTGGVLLPDRGFTGRFSAIYLYALAELIVGIGAVGVPMLFHFGEELLLPAGEMDSTRYLFLSAAIICLSILPFCIAMGTTFPFMLAFVRERSDRSPTSFSFLYLANVLGAMCGTLLTPLVLVELFGFQKTLLIGCIGNFLVAAVAIYNGKKTRAGDATDRDERPEVVVTEERQIQASPASAMIPVILLTTGGVSMALEVIWTRAFTPVLETQVYSFSSLLFVYLLATWLGSRMYRQHLFRRRVARTGTLLSILALSGFLQIVIADPRLHVEQMLSLTNKLTMLASIVPICSVLGYLTPKLIDEYALGRPNQAGRAYAINVIGSIMGPLIGSYLLLPVFGVKWSSVISALPLLLLALVWREKVAGGRALARTTLGFAALLLIGSAYYGTSYEEYSQQFKKPFTEMGGIIRRDHTATVISYGKGEDKELLVNGTRITIATSITKVMGHMPLAFLSMKKKPESALVICFGMGTTYRSLLSWDIDAVAVELVPSVRDSFGYFFEDAKDVLKNPRGRIVIDDGRRFLKRTDETFDVITIDPPPPTETAGSSLLYSEEFYDLVKRRLTPGGILHQWFPGGEDSIFRAVIRSLTNSFPHVRAYRSYADWGWHFLASMEPIEEPTVDEMIASLPEAARRDLMEWTTEYNLKELVSKILDKEREFAPNDLLRDDASERISDDRPFNEYYALRRLWKWCFVQRYIVIQ